MVGVPRSKGCSFCVKRRVKCDEARPACSRCQKYGKECPGYDRGFKFVAGVPYRSHRQRRHRGKFQDEHSQAGSTSSTLNDAISGCSEMSLTFHPQRSVAPGSLAIHSPVLHQIQALSTLIADVSRPCQSVPDFSVHARWLSFIPARLGTSSVLDKAICCFTAHHLGNTSSSEQLVRYGRLAYGQALSSLQKALYDPVDAITSETLCATLVLCMYELFSCTKYDSWMKHADGIGRLLQLRGPDRHWNEFESTLLMTCKGLIVRILSCYHGNHTLAYLKIRQETLSAFAACVGMDSSDIRLGEEVNLITRQIMEALFSGKDCFLDTDDWQHLSMEPFDKSIPSDLYHIIEDFNRHLAVCPGLVREAYSIASATQTQVSSLIRRTHNLYDLLRAWFDLFSVLARSPEEVPSSWHDPLYPMVYHYANPSTATLFCGYYASIIILHEVLKRSHYDADYTAETSALTDKICKSVEYMYGTGILGPYRIGFSLRVAFEVATVIKKHWIKNWLVRLGKFYVATSPHNFPPIEEAEIPS